MSFPVLTARPGSRLDPGTASIGIRSLVGFGVLKDFAFRGSCLDGQPAACSVRLDDQIADVLHQLAVRYLPHTKTSRPSQHKAIPSALHSHIIFCDRRDKQMIVIKHLIT